MRAILARCLNRPYNGLLKTQHPDIFMKENILKILKKHKDPHITRRQIAQKMNLESEEKAAFRRTIRELTDEGVLVQLKKHYYLIRGRGNTATGKIQCHRSGFAFLIPDPDCGLNGDIYISGTHLGDAVHGDRALVQILDSSLPRTSRRGSRQTKVRSADKKEGRVIRVLERSHKRIIAKILFLKKTIAIPLDSRYHYSVTITNAADFSLENEDVVSVELITEPTAHTRPQGKIVTLVGKPGDPELPLLITIAKHDIPLEFPREVMKEARSIPGKIPPDEILRRSDFRDLPAMTIDGDAAFDFDDAVNVEKMTNGDFRLWVHIADVSHYVLPDSHLDREAFRRGTSVYFPDRAIPMLPDALSSDICSLLPDTDRLAVTAVLTIHGQNGRTIAAEFTPSIIQSRARMTYTQVARILEGDEKLTEQFKDLVPQFHLMVELTKILNTRRRRRGAIDFDLPEEEVRFDQWDNVIGIFKAERNAAHRIIEEFMLAANEAVATRFASADIPSIYRIHEEPDPAKVQEFSETARLFGISFPTHKEAYSSKDFQKLTDGFDDSPLGKYLTYIMLRSFKLAVYSENNMGHFGLAARNYTHFTSPIRRYPDLVIHRLLLKSLTKTNRQASETEQKAALAETARHASEREREAVEAEREILAWKKAEFMNNHLGETFEGFVSGIRPNGFHVELVDFFIEGFVNLTTLADDYYEFIDAHHAFRGERTGKMFRLGTPVVIQVDRVDMDRFLLDFSIVKILKLPKESPPAPPRARRSSRKSTKTRTQKSASDRPASGGKRKKSHNKTTGFNKRKTK